MKKLIHNTLLAASICTMVACGGGTSSLNGAGSSFIYPVMTKWTSSYQAATGAQINYQPIGSGGGITQLKNKTIDFAATDMPLTTQKLATENWHQFPAVMGGIVPVINIHGIATDKLVLSGPLLSEMYMGKIKKWNDPAIKKLNPKLVLPNKSIILVYRADGSGTTFNFTNYLSQVSSEWKTKVGVATLVSWPYHGLGAKGNAGVANQVQNMKNSIGYVEYAYAAQNHMSTARLKNKSNKVVSANLASFQAAAKNADWTKVKDKGFGLVLTNQLGANSWPIVATTYILLPAAAANNKDSRDIRLNSRQVLKFFMWTFNNPQARAHTKKLDYISLPQNLVAMIAKKFTIASSAKQGQTGAAPKQIQKHQGTVYKQQKSYQDAAPKQIQSNQGAAPKQGQSNQGAVAKPGQSNQGAVAKPGHSHKQAVPKK